jgi:hypothetical protein
MDLMGLIAGAVLGWVITHVYHVLSNQQQKQDIDKLRQDNEMLRRLNEGVLRLQAQAMGEELTVGEDGRYTGGLDRRSTGSSAGTSWASGNLNVSGPPRRHRSKIYPLANS